MNYAEIKTADIANGEGVRVSLFVSGCTRGCKNCFNKIAWDFSYGKPFSEETEEMLLQALSPSYISGLTLLGGDPFEPSNQRALLPFLKKVKARFPAPAAPYTILDGRFIEELKDIRLNFRGSSNQRIIDVKSTLKAGNIVLYMT